MLSSDASAAEYRGGRLGSYVHEGQFAGRPYFRQKDTEGKADNFIFSNRKIWWVSLKIGRYKRFPVKPPKHFWTSSQRLALLELWLEEVVRRWQFPHFEADSLIPMWPGQSIRKRWCASDKPRKLPVCIWRLQVRMLFALRIQGSPSWLPYSTDSCDLDLSIA